MTLTGIISLVIVLAIVFYLYRKNISSQTKVVLDKISDLKDKTEFQDVLCSFSYLDSWGVNNCTVYFFDDCVIVSAPPRFPLPKIISDSFTSIYLFTKKDFLASHKGTKHFEFTLFNIVAEFTQLDVSDNGNVILKGLAVEKGILTKNQYLAVENITIKFASGLDKTKLIDLLNKNSIDINKLC